MLKPEKYPRLLIVSSSAFNPLSGGGITFTNLFRGWPKDRIATAHSDRIPVTHDVCDKYYFLGKKEFQWKFPFSLVNFFSGQDKVGDILRKANFSEKGKSLKAGLFRLTQRIIKFIVGEEMPVKTSISNELRNWISEFKPQIIYTILGSLPYIRLVRKIAGEFNIPIIVHMMDDWPEVIYRNGIFGPYLRRRMKKELQQIINESAARLGICDAMSAAYSKRYKRHFEGAFHNALDVKTWEQKTRKEWIRKSPFSILYAGALMTNSQLGSIRDVADAVAFLHKEGEDIEFRIYAPWYAARPNKSGLEREGCVSVHEMPEKMDVSDLFAGADLLLLPVNFDKASVAYIKYSMPTKVPAYMFSGTPTLAYGPKEVASIQYAQKWAYCVIKRNENELKDAIKKMASDEKLRRDYALKAQKIAAEKHDREKESAKFHEILIRAAKTRKS